MSRPQATGLAYARGATDVPLLYETIGENLRRTVERFGERDALVVRHQDRRLSYRELWDQVDLAARAFMARGCAKATGSVSGRRIATSGS